LNEILDTKLYQMEKEVQKKEWTVDGAVSTPN